MLTASDSLFRHGLQNVALILLSLVFLPFDLIVVSFALALNRIRQPASLDGRKARLATAEWRPKTILVTGVGMTKGLTLARLFHQAGHNVIAADFESHGALACGRFSTAVRTFYPLRRPNALQGPQPYLEDLLTIVTSDKVDLWVSCSGVASALEDGMAKEVIEARTTCKAVQFDVATTQLLHEKDTFIKHTQDIGLKVPETYKVTDMNAAKDFLDKAFKGKRKFLLKPIGVQDADRADMTLLPKHTKEATLQHLSKRHFSDESSWILQQFLDGLEYCTHSLVVRGEVKAFVACPSAELLMHYEALPQDSKLHRAMFEFTQTFATQHGDNFTGHLSFDFLTEASETGLENPIVYPIECNPRAHTAVVLFTGDLELAQAYLSVLEPKKAVEHCQKSEIDSYKIISPSRTHKFYWVGHDLVELVLSPLLHILEGSGRGILPGISRFMEHLLSWYDGTFVSWDPMPWFILYHIYWPMQFLNALLSQTKWSRINVSTTKMFYC